MSNINLTKGETAILAAAGAQPAPAVRGRRRAKAAAQQPEVAEGAGA